MNDEEKKRLKQRAWVIMLIVFVAGIAMAWAQNKVVPVLELGSFAETLGIDDVTAGWISSVFVVFGVILALPAAGMVRKWGVLKTGLLAMIVTTIGGVIGAFAPNATVLIVSRVVEGFGVSLISVIAPTVISMWFAPEKRGLPMGIWGAWQMVAQAGTFLFAGSILGLFGGWQGMWWVGLIIMVIAIVLYAWKVRTPPSEANYADAEESDGSIFEVFRYPGVWMIALVAMFFCLACFGWVTWVVTYWSEVLGLDPDFAGSIVGWVYVAEIFIVVLEGYILDKVKSRKKLGVIMTLLYGILLLTAFILPDAIWIIPFAILYPFLEGIVCTVFWTICPQTTPKPALAAASLAVMQIGMNIGMLLGPPITATLMSLNDGGGWIPATIQIGICGILCAVFMGLTQLYNEKGEKIKG